MGRPIGGSVATPGDLRSDDDGFRFRGASVGWVLRMDNVAATASTWRCRWCGGAAGTVVVDLGDQPPADHFPPRWDPTVDRRYSLRMVMCGTCQLAQLEEDPTTAEEPLGVQPVALVRQARQAVTDLIGAGLGRPGAQVAEFTSPHGGNWSDLLGKAGLVAAGDDVHVDLVVDSLSLMHAPDQRKALA